MSVNSNLSYDEVQGVIHSKFIDHWLRTWKNGVILSSKGKFMSHIVDRPKLRKWLSLRSRRMECITARLRIGHVGVQAHLNRFEMSDTNQCGYCRLTDTVEHFLLYCNRYNTSRNVFRNELRNNNVDFNLKNILSGGHFSVTIQKRILSSLVKFLSSTNRVDTL